MFLALTFAWVTSGFCHACFLMPPVALWETKFALSSFLLGAVCQSISILSKSSLYLAIPSCNHPWNFHFLWCWKCTLPQPSEASYHSQSTISPRCCLMRISIVNASLGTLHASHSSASWISLSPMPSSHWHTPWPCWQTTPMQLPIPISNLSTCSCLAAPVCYKNLICYKFRCWKKPLSCIKDMCV